MCELAENKKLQKKLKLLDVFVLATGTTLSAGFFLLPGLAAEKAGPSIIIAYIIAAIPLIPATFCTIELTTAMPRAGGFIIFLTGLWALYLVLLGVSGHGLQWY